MGNTHSSWPLSGLTHKLQHFGDNTEPAGRQRAWHVKSSVLHFIMAFLSCPTQPVWKLLGCLWLFSPASLYTTSSFTAPEQPSHSPPTTTSNFLYFKETWSVSCSRYLFSSCNCNETQWKVKYEQKQIHKVNSHGRNTEREKAESLQDLSLYEYKKSLGHFWD